MRILIVPDKFKGSLTAPDVCEAVAAGVQQTWPAAEVVSLPMADGGEGTCAILTRNVNGSVVKARVSDPLGRSIDAVYGISPDGETAFIEMAAASGLELLSKAERNPLVTSTYGTGELIMDAVNRGVRHVVIGIGGSATNDMGMGMAAALGFVFLDADGKTVQPAGRGMADVVRIIPPADVEKLNRVEFIILCDVSNPLYGPDGAAFIFGPQKGAHPGSVELLDAGLRNLHQIIQSQFLRNVDFPGAGAAGGMGAGALFFLNGRIVRGTDYMIGSLRIEQEIERADVVFTGEGSLDAQSLSGKVVSGIAELCQKYRRECLVVTGRNKLTQEEMDRLGIRVFALTDKVDEATAMRNARELITTMVSEFIAGRQR